MHVVPVVAGEGSSITCRRPHALPCRSVMTSCVKGISNIEPEESLAQAKQSEVERQIEDWSATVLPDQRDMVAAAAFLAAAAAVFASQQAIARDLHTFSSL